MNIMGSVNFRLKGDGKDKLLNKILAEKIKCRGIRNEGEFLCGSCSPFTWKVLREFCEELALEYEHKLSFGLYKVIGKIFARKGLIVGFFLGLAGVTFLSGIYLKTDIDGCGKDLKQSILDYLAYKGIDYGDSLGEIDLHSLEIELMKNVSGISWAGVYTTGSTLNINVVESEEKPEYNQRRLPSNLVALRDGQIVAVQIYGGELVVPVGSGVHKGQVIVSGIVSLDEETTAFRRSKGKIFAKYKEEIVFECNYRATRKVVLENTEKRKFFSFFNLSIPLFISQPDYEMYNTYESSQDINFLDLKLPFAIKTIEYAPYDFEVTEYTYEQALAEVYRLKSNYESNFLEECEILDVSEDVSSDEQGVKLKVSYEVIGDIAGEKEILIK